MQSELSKLIADVKENLLYMQELGVSGMQVDIEAIRFSQRVSKEATKQVSETHTAARPAEPARVAPPADLPQRQTTGLTTKSSDPAAGASSRSLRETLEAAKLSHRSGAEPLQVENAAPILEKTVTEKTAPVESLFGDISPTNELAPSGETLEGIHNSIAGCKLCRLWEGRTQIVNSTGNPKARLMFIGEAPGADEDAQGKPFVGRAGQLLTKIIEAIGMNRDEVFIGNINRCRPPGNRAPMADEAASCKPFLLREIAVVRPAVIVVLGATAMQNLLETKAPIGKLRGNFQDYFGIKVMPTFHPAYLLRDPHKKREVWEDMKKVKAVLDNL